VCTVESAVKAINIHSDSFLDISDSAVAKDISVSHLSAWSVGADLKYLKPASDSTVRVLLQ